MAAFTSNPVSTSWGVTMDRRKFLKTGTTLIVAASSSAMANDPVRYPHPDLVSLGSERMCREPTFAEGYSERIARAPTIAGPD